MIVKPGRVGTSWEVTSDEKQAVGTQGGSGIWDPHAKPGSPGPRPTLRPFLCMLWLLPGGTPQFRGRPAAPRSTLRQDVRKSVSQEPGGAGTSVRAAPYPPSPLWVRQRDKASRPEPLAAQTDVH